MSSRRAGGTLAGAALVVFVGTVIPDEYFEYIGERARALGTWLTTGGKPASFWAGQAALLLALVAAFFATTWVWDRWLDAPTVRVLGAIVEAGEWADRRFGRPAVAAVKRMGAALAAAVARRIPARLRRAACGGDWALQIAWASSLLALLAQHVANAIDASSAKGLHASELPQLAAGAAHWRWGGVCTGAQFGSLPQLLAALPLRLGWLGAWPPDSRWDGAGAAKPPPACGGRGDELWLHRSGLA